MGEKVRCEICDRTFKDEEGLAQHNAAKHPIANTKRNFNSKKIRNWTIFIMIIALIIIFLGWMISSAFTSINSCKTAPVEEINIGGHTNLKLHIHIDLRILIDGNEEFIPANIGILSGVMRPIHTHDASGEIHIEGPCARDFTLGDFFKIWGREFNSQCVFDKCTDAGSLKITVNGKDNNEFENYIMRDRDNILIEFEPK